MIYQANGGKPFKAGFCCEAQMKPQNYRNACALTAALCNGSQVVAYLILNGQEDRRGLLKDFGAWFEARQGEAKNWVN